MLTGFKSALINLVSPDKQMRYQLHDAVEFGDINSVQRVIDCGIDVNVRDTYGHSALHIAALKGKTEIAKVLLQNQAEINACDDNAQTPLHFSVEFPEMTKMLLEQGAAINRVNKYGDTPLSRAKQLSSRFQQSPYAESVKILEAELKKTSGDVIITVSEFYPKTSANMR